MLKLTSDTIKNAVKRTREHRPRIVGIAYDEIAVTCGNPDHPHGHVTRFERRADGSLWGECFLRGTGEGCPAALGHRVCYHLTGGVTRFLLNETNRAAADAAEAAKREAEEEAHLAGQIEIAVMLDAPLPPPPEDAEKREPAAAA